MEYDEHETFTWVFSRDECARRGRFANRGPEYFEICFEEKAGVIYRLTWKTVSQSPEPEIFIKRCV